MDYLRYKELAGDLKISEADRKRLKDFQPQFKATAYFVAYALHDWNTKFLIDLKKDAVQTSN